MKSWPNSENFISSPYMNWQCNFAVNFSDEKDLVGLYCMDHYFAEQNSSQPPYAFRRQQSRLYQKLHPDPVSYKNHEFHFKSKLCFLCEF